MIRYHDGFVKTHTYFISELQMHGSYKNIRTAMALTHPGLGLTRVCKI